MGGRNGWQGVDTSHGGSNWEVWCGGVSDKSVAVETSAGGSKCALGGGGRSKCAVGGSNEQEGLDLSDRGSN